MRILFSYALVGRGGDAVQVRALADAFHNLGHEVQLVGPHPLHPYEFESLGGRLRSELRQLPWWAKDLFELGADLISLRKTTRLLRREAIDLIFHRAGIYDLIGGIRVPGGCPLVVHLDAPFPMERAFRDEGYFVGLHKRSMRSLGQSAQLIVTVSEAAKSYYVQLGLPEEKILILPNGISERLLQWGLQHAREHPPFAKGPPWTVGFVGSLSRWHRVDLLLEAVRLLNGEADGSWRLAIVGYGEESAKLHKQAKELEMESQIIWLGPLPHERAFEEIAQFDIAALSHTLPTGAPLKLFEYAAVARPTIAPDLPNLRGLFSEDEMCFVQPESPQALAETMLELCREPEAARGMGERAQARVRGYTWEQAISHLLKVLCHYA